jgi:hypothetical protein
MTFSDYLLNGILVGLVLLQIRGRKLSLHMLLLPVGLVIYFGHTYLHAFPTAGNDLWLTLGGPAIGLALGLGAGLSTKITRGKNGVLRARAGFLAAGLWILGTGSRMAFEIYASHGGGASIERFSVSHDITTAAAWTTGLVLMALAEVLSRTGALAWKAYGRKGVAAGAPAPFSPATSGIMGVREPVH